MEVYQCIFHDIILLCLPIIGEMERHLHRQLQIMEKRLTFLKYLQWNDKCGMQISDGCVV